MKLIKTTWHIVLWCFNWFSISLTIFILVMLPDKKDFQFDYRFLIIAAVVGIIIGSYSLWRFKTKDRRERKKAHHLDGDPEPF